MLFTRSNSSVVVKLYWVRGRHDLRDVKQDPGDVCTGLYRCTPLVGQRYQIFTVPDDIWQWQLAVPTTRTSGSYFSNGQRILLHLQSI